MNAQLFLCPYCTLDLSLINSFNKKAINTQILFHTNCNERNHTNFIKDKFKQFHLSREHCESHKENLARYQCITCQTNFCSICKNKHEIDEPTHMMISIESKLNKKCKEHNSKCLLYCKTCKSLICEKCMKQHSGHEVKDNIDEFYYSKDKERLNLYLVMKQKQVEAINKMITDLLKLKNVVQLEIEEIAEQIDEGSIFKQYDNNYYIKDNSNQNKNKPKILSQSQPINSISSMKNSILSKQNYSSLSVVNSYKAHSKMIYYIKEIKNNRIVTVSEDKTISIYDYSIKKFIGNIQSKSTLGDFIPLAQDTKLAVVTNDKNISIFALSTFKQQYWLHEHLNFISSLVELAQYHYLLSASYDCSICIWDYERGLNLKMLYQPVEIEKVIHFNHHDQIAFYSKNEDKKNVYIYDINSSNLTNKRNFFVQNIEGGFENLNDEYLVMYNKDNKIAYINLKTGENKSIAAHNDQITQLIKLNSKTNFYSIATIAKDRTIKIWDIEKEQLMYSIIDMNGLKKICELRNGFIFCICNSNMLSIYNKKKVVAYLKAEKIKDVVELVNGEIAVSDEKGNVMIYN